MGEYFRNLETNKLELHFEKIEYMALSEEQKKEIKSNFLFSRAANAWVSRCKFPNLYRAEAIAKKLGLEDTGKQGEKLTFEEQQKVKAEKAERRAERYEIKSENAETRGKALQAPIDRMHGDISFFTQPNINSAAGRAFTRRRNRMWAAWESGFEEFKKSEYYKERAEVARETAAQANAPKDKAFCIRRIEEAEKTIRAQKRNIESYEKQIERIEAGETLKRYTGEFLTIETIESWIDHAEEITEDAISKSMYYHACIENLGGILFSKENIKPGYIVKIKRWRTEIVTVESTGPKNFVYRSADNWTMKASYAEIESIIEAKEPEEQKIDHPFKVGETITFNFWNGEQYATKVFTVTKITPQKITIKSGSERAKVVTVHKAYQRDNVYYISVAGARDWYYKES